MLKTQLAGIDLVLHASGAIYLPLTQTLLVADAHFGKAVSFRKLGVPVPQGTTSGTLARLSAVIAECGAQQIVFLGDFLHSARAHSAATLATLHQWRAAHSGLTLTLVRGNHDSHAGDPPLALDIRVVNEPLFLTQGNTTLALCHHPQPVAGAYVLAGHWHPCVRLAGRGHDRLRLPCFWFGQAPGHGAPADAVAPPSHGVGILPAFGQFTGMHPVKPLPGDRVFGIAGDTVRALS